MKIITVTLPAVWARALIDNDWDGLKFNWPEEARRAIDWLNDERLSALSCGNETFTATYDGKPTECMEYQCTPFRVKQ